MSQPLTDQRPRAELIAELYDRHAAGLFAYCADQLGDPGSASDVLVTVLSGVPDTEPPRAALYALARREIHRRDVVYAPPAVDPLIDPATALVERTLRELRPHQREVLVLCAVCGLSKAELAWVLDVAPDTAEELAVGAGHRFRQALGAALASIGVRVPKPVADVYGALGVAPLRDVLGRLPWPQPPGAVRIHLAGSRTATPAPLFVKPRWPSPPVWPQPLAETDPATSTMIFPKELLTPPSPTGVREHEATTAPMPRFRDPLAPPTDLARPLRDPLAAFDTSHPFTNPRAQGPRGAFTRDPRPFPQEPHVRDPQASSVPPAGERPFFMAAPEGEAEPFATGDVLLPKGSPEPFATGDVLLPGESGPPPAPFAAGDPFGERSSRAGGLRRPRPGRRTRTSPAEDVLVHKGPARPFRSPHQEEADPILDTAPLFRPRPKPSEPIYRLPPAHQDGEPTATATAPRQDHASNRPPAQHDPAERPPAQEGSPRPAPAQEGMTSQTRARESAGRPVPAQQESLLAPRPVRSRPTPKRRPDRFVRPGKTRRRGERHYDWAWEAIGFLVCVAIAMIVFFSVPMLVDP
ncbi:MAG TPA: hypothetical protein VFV66_13230 [Nonomuraea sp.]|nr:hypothetical protein [Nonomuraea sp.]